MENLTKTWFPEAASPKAALVSRADTAVRSRRLGQPPQRVPGCQLPPVALATLQGVMFSFGAL